MVFVLTLKVLENAELGDTIIKLSDVNASNGHEDLYVQDVTGKITVVEKNSSTPTPTSIEPTPTQTNIEPTPTNTEGDTKAPVIINVENGQTYNRSVTPLAMDENLDTVELYKDGEKVVGYRNGDTISQDGYYRIVAKDKAGNVTDISFVLKKAGEATATPSGPDTKAPVITGVENGKTYYEAVTPIATDENLNTVELYKGGIKVSGYRNGATISALGYYKLIATDKAGNSTTVTFTVSSYSATTIPTATPYGPSTTGNATIRPTSTSDGRQIDITDRDSLPYAGPDDLILPAIYVMIALSAIAFIQYKRIKND